MIEQLWRIWRRRIALDEAMSDGEDDRRKKNIWRRGEGWQLNVEAERLRWRAAVEGNG